MNESLLYQNKVKKWIKRIKNRSGKSWKGLFVPPSKPEQLKN